MSTREGVCMKRINGNGYKRLNVKRPVKIEHLKIGSVQYEIVNTPEYCGKIFIQKEGTTTPAHYHKKKHETFLIWSGNMHMVVDGKEFDMKPGDVMSIDRRIVHEFTATGGDTTFIEVSTSSSPRDSYFVEKGMWEKVNQRSEETTDYEWPF